jgi:hypothetical protein
MKTSDILIAAKARIDSPEKWCKGVSWRTKSGDVTECSEIAYSCCGYGAITAVLSEDNRASMPHIQANTTLELAIGGQLFSRWNDAPERTHAEVMAAFDRAIAIALEKEAE